jgi:murein L,D-transpeptidase YcbB/YkuD
MRRGELWPEIGDGGEIRPGDRDARIPAIRKMLAINGDLPVSLANAGDRLDPELGRALRAFQARHGLAETGDLDSPTLAELRVPVEARLRQVQINLERRRWQNRDLGNDHVYINLADSSLKLVRGGKSEWFGTLIESPELAALPTFYGTIRAIEFDPANPDNSRLAVESEFIDSIGTEAAPRRFSIDGMSEIASALVEANAGGAAAGTSADGKRRILQLEPPVTLFVTYLTAWANRDGTLQLRPDKFSRDAKLAELLKLQ